jgi:hypothetical protein
MDEQSRVSPKWFQDPGAPQAWYTGSMTSVMELHYTVTKLDGFTLNNNGKTIPFQDNNRIAIGMSPIGEMTNICDPSGRDAFRFLTRLLGVTLYVDLKTDSGYYPSDSGGEYQCLYDDTQNPHSGMGGSFQAILDDLADYIDAPSKEAAVRARFNLQQLKLVAPFFSMDDATEFESRRGNLRRFVEEKAEAPEKADLKKKDRALEDIASMRSIIFNNRHNGSGACRNPILHFQVVSD